ncbi:hypothetical protein ARMGADRAFT_1029653 [Armillaria gallica]|uniref:Uncharacterized protein n=1 Tax=Armillaria gallica TaxID=47427 RepID=A0A2H3DEW4_ARMGA|nr:hypothetical protein ARMGADRAFT_1029653 [Armillaria gallica]
MGINRESEILSAMKVAIRDGKEEGLEQMHCAVSGEGTCLVVVVGKRREEERRGGRRRGKRDWQSKYQVRSPETEKEPREDCKRFVLFEFETAGVIYFPAVNRLEMEGQKLTFQPVRREGKRRHSAFEGPRRSLERTAKRFARIRLCVVGEGTCLVVVMEEWGLGAWPRKCLEEKGGERGSLHVRSRETEKEPREDCKRFALFELKTEVPRREGRRRGSLHVRSPETEKDPQNALFGFETGRETDVLIGYLGVEEKGGGEDSLQEKSRAREEVSKHFVRIF